MYGPLRSILFKIVYCDFNILPSVMIFSPAFTLTRPRMANGHSDMFLFSFRSPSSAVCLTMCGRSEMAVGQHTSTHMWAASRLCARNETKRMEMAKLNSAENLDETNNGDDDDDDGDNNNQILCKPTEEVPHIRIKAKKVDDGRVGISIISTSTI